MREDKNKSDMQDDSANSESKPKAGGDPVNADGTDDALEIASPGEALCASYEDDTSASESKSDNKSKNLEESQDLAQETPNGSFFESPSDTEPQKAQAPEHDSSVKRLSSEQVQNIASRFNPQKEIATESDRKQVLKSIENEGDSAKSITKSIKANPSYKPSSLGSPASPSSSSSSPPPKSPMMRSAVPAEESAPITARSHAKTPSRGVAYFSGRVITLGAAENMSAGDELLLGGNKYELKPGKDKSSAMNYVAAAVLVIVSAFAGKFLLGGGGSSGGEIVGVALSQTGLPYADGAVVRLPELGISTVSSPSGLFRFTDIPNGTYKLEYNLAGSLGGSQLVTVGDEEASMVTLDGPVKRLAQALTESPKQSSRQSARQSSGNKRKSAPASKKSKQSSSSRGSLAVTSGVSGAVVFIDNQELGKVNNTFRRMQSGERTIRVEKAGYEPYIANVTIKENKISKVDVNLVKINIEPAPEAAPVLSASDLYEYGRDYYRAGDYDAALDHLGEALKIDPSLADAYYMKAETLVKTNNPKDAYLDYIRAGEIWSNQKRSQDALSAFDNAVNVSVGSAVAHKVRGDYYRSAKQLDKAIEDYEEAIEADKKYYEGHLALGIALFETRLYRKADKELRRAQDYTDKDPVLFHYLMLNSLAKNDLGDVNRYYKQFKNDASDAELARFRSDNKMVAVRRIVKD